MMWKILLSTFYNSNAPLKPLKGSTRWKSRIKATRPLRSSSDDLFDAWIEIPDNDSVDKMVRHETETFAFNVRDFKFLCCLLIRCYVLNELNAASKLM